MEGSSWSGAGEAEKLRPLSGPLTSLCPMSRALTRLLNFFVLPSSADGGPGLLPCPSRPENHLGLCGRTPSSAIATVSKLASRTRKILSGFCSRQGQSVLFVRILPAAYRIYGGWPLGSIDRIYTQDHQGCAT
jgi:hypothetical protein